MCEAGHDCLGSHLRLTLLRGTEYPDPHADLGVHEFTYSLLPHGGDWRAADTVRQAYALNVPLLPREAAPGEPPVSYLTVAGPAILEALKPAEVPESLRPAVRHVRVGVADESEMTLLEGDLQHLIAGWYDGWVTVESMFARG